MFNNSQGDEMSDKKNPSAVLHVELFGELGRKWKKYTKERGMQAIIIRRAVRLHINAVEKMQKGDK